MNGTLKTIIAFAVGAGCGGFTMFKILSASYEQQLNDELDQFRAADERRKNRPTNPIYVANDIESVKTTYNIARQKAEDIPEDEESETDEENVPEYGVFPLPYPISEEEYSTERLDLDKLSLTYYLADNTLCDDQEVPVDDILQLVGQEMEDYFASASVRTKTKYDKTTFARNESLGADFEISINPGSYAKNVVGYIGNVEEDVPVVAKKSRRKKEEVNGDNE